MKSPMDCKLAKNLSLFIPLPVIMQKSHDIGSGYRLLQRCTLNIIVLISPANIYVYAFDKSKHILKM